MRPVKRILCWRIRQGGRWIDLVEERQDETVVAFVGLINGREAIRADDRRGVGVDLIRTAMLAASAGKTKRPVATFRQMNTEARNTRF
jgi:hypothetical protein